jgi:putative lipase involved disintegration of autophagic bodies|eukprot:597866-Prymnesium_polylepis.1
MVASDLTTRDHMVLIGRGKERGNVKVVLKGMNGDKYAVDNQHRNDTIFGREKDYSYLDDLHKAITDDFNSPNIEVISYSNGGAKGMYLADKYNLPHYSVDPLLGP